MVYYGIAVAPGMTLVSARVGGATFLAAAIYEFSPIKNRCLTHCTSAPFTACC